MREKSRINDLVAMGGNTPAFSKPLPVGQLHFPTWIAFREVFEGIFSRKYYTNHGPLLKELEQRLEQFLDCRHAICVTNATLGLAMTAKSMGLSGKIILPSFTFIATAEAMSIAGLEPIFCDVSCDLGLITPANVAPLLEKYSDISAILGVHLWGNGCCSAELEVLAKKHDVQLFYDAAHAFGCVHEGKNISTFGTASVFSFHATKIINSAEGGVICTNDDDIAEKLRNIRSSYGVRKVVPIPYTGNGRMSEAQAAMALLSLDRYEENVAQNKILAETYRALLKEIAGLEFVTYKASSHNYQYVVVRIDEQAFGISREVMLEILQKENIICRKYFSLPAHQALPYQDLYASYFNPLPNTDLLSRTLLQLPNGQLVAKEDVHHICNIIQLIAEHTDQVNEIL